jgi:hypothetical protein
VLIIHCYSIGIAFCILFGFSAYVDASWTWAHSYGKADSSYSEGASSIHQTKDGGYIIAGFTHNQPSFKGKILIMKFNNAGCIEWQKMYGGSDYYSAVSIKQTNDDGYLFVGNLYYSNSFMLSYALILKLDSAGSIIWQKYY